MISIEASTRTCKVDTASAARSESDRFLNPNLVVCPNWTGFDLAGRQVCADSFYTKRAGCNSAADRVIVENNLRPQYYDYINLSDEGLRSQLYGDNMYYTDAGVLRKQRKMAEGQSGNFGGVFSFPGTNEATCSYGAYELGQQQVQRQMRANAMKGHHGRHGDSTGHHHHVEHFQPDPRNPFTGNRELARANAAATNGFRNCQFRSRSGF